MTVESSQFKKIALIVAIGSVLVATGVVLYAEGGTTGLVLVVGLLGFFFVFVFLPDIIATGRGVDLKIKGDVAGDEIGLPLVILAFPYRLWQALTSIPTKEKPLEADAQVTSAADDLSSLSNQLLERTHQDGTHQG